MTGLRTRTHRSGSIGFSVHSISDTLNPYNTPFPGMPGCHPGAGLRQRRATGGFLLLSVRGL
jgi:hypothetical protein